MLSEILARAQQRAQELGLSYEGALTPQEAWQVLELAPAAKLVDVRSRAELDLVGRIPQAAHIEWAYYPDWSPNPDFVAQLKMQVDAESLVMFLCRTGARSNKAANAAHAAGYTEVYNVLEGFEGDTDHAKEQRGGINGWQAAGLPWTNLG
ncbi:MAG TPA: rhodanese-like domain-containing protein [Gallionella sp.]|nr:rhodanese-like domain-containing protein [Gallionella sp.]